MLRSRVYTDVLSQSSPFVVLCSHFVQSCALWVKAIEELLPLHGHSSCRHMSPSPPPSPPSPSRLDGKDSQRHLPYVPADGARARQALSTAKTQKHLSGSAREFVEIESGSEDSVVGRLLNGAAGVFVVCFLAHILFAMMQVAINGLRMVLKAFT